MANPTTNFGWVMPTSSSLVTNLPADFNTFGQGVDTSLAQLKGGTTGQILSKTSATDMAFTWITNDVGDITAVTAGTGISGGGTSGAVTITNSMATEITAKGDLIAGTGSATFDNLPVGTNGQTLVADSSTATGLKWAAASSGALTLISRTSFSNVASQTFDGVFTTTYENYVVYFNMLYAATAADDPQLSLRYEGTDISTAHYTSRTAITIGTTTQTITTQSGAAFVSLSSYTGSAAEPGGGYMHFANVGNTANKGNGWSAYNDGGSGVCCWVQSTFASGAGANKIATGFKIFSSSSNITGTVAIYGLAKS